LQIGWTDRLNFRTSLSNLTGSLGDEVQMITAYVTDGLKAQFFSTEEQRLETLYSFSRIASRMGFNLATLQEVGNRLWIVFER